MLGRAGKPQSSNPTCVLQAFALFWLPAFWLCIRDCCSIITSPPPLKKKSGQCKFLPS